MSALDAIPEAESPPAVPDDLVEIRDVARWLGWDARRTRHELHALDAEVGNVLFRRPGRRTKFRVSAAKARILVEREAERRGSKGDAARDPVNLHRRVDHLQKTVSELERQFVEFRRMSKAYILRKSHHPGNS